MAKSVLPWSLKGVSPEAREIAKKAAAQQGITIGEWVSRAIRDVGPEPGAASEPRPAGRVSGGPVVASPEDEEALRAAVRERIYAAEEQVAHVVGPLQDIIERMARRLTRLEEATAKNPEPAAQIPEQRRLDGW
jgi:localization factor PodJL